MRELYNQYRLNGMGSVRSVHLQRDRVFTICMICTRVSVGVVDLQDLYNIQDLYDLPEWTLCDMYDLYTGKEYVRSP